MILLTANGIRKNFGPEPVLDGVAFDIRPGEKIGLIGPNGTGKTTLLNILAGQESADAGTIVWHPAIRWGYLEQQPEFDTDETVWEAAAGAVADLVALQQECEAVATEIAAAESDAERAALGERFEHLQHELSRRDAYSTDHKIERILTGLKFPEAIYARPIRSLSGGQQNRLLLAQLLIADPDVMILDEPSNHLDLETTQWLEEFLASSQQALLIVSHDRYLLDKVTNHTLELYAGTVERYPGNFSAYRRQKAERVEVQRRTYEKQQTEIAKLQDFIRRNSYGQKSAQAEDRRKKLERIEPVDPPREIHPPPMSFPAASRTGDIVMRVEELAFGFGERPLFSDLTFDILRGQRWGILGPNGCGKSTLVKCLLGEIQPTHGQVAQGAGVSIGYFDQMLHCVDSDAQAVEAIRPPKREFVTQQRRDLLARFGITGDMVFQKVSSFSGGERNRTALAKLAALEANVLVFDEPTNHLDLWSRDALTKALKQFDGAVLIVSHDRYFLNETVERLLVFEPGRVRVIAGNYDAYLYEKKSAGNGRQGAVSQPAETSQPTKADASRDNTKPRRKRKYRYRKVADIEAEILERETRLAEIHELLTQPAVLRDGEQVKNLQAEVEEQQDAIDQLYDHWEEASELN